VNIFSSTGFIWVDLHKGL